MTGGPVEISNDVLGNVYVYGRGQQGNICSAGVTTSYNSMRRRYTQAFPSPIRAGVGVGICLQTVRGRHRIIHNQPTTSLQDDWRDSRDLQ